MFSVHFESLSPQEEKLEEKKQARSHYIITREKPVTQRDLIKLELKSVQITFPIQVNYFKYIKMFQRKNFSMVTLLIAFINP